MPAKDRGNRFVRLNGSSNPGWIVSMTVLNKFEGDTMNFIVDLGGLRMPTIVSAKFLHRKRRSSQLFSIFLRKEEKRRVVTWIFPLIVVHERPTFFFWSDWDNSFWILEAFSWSPDEAKTFASRIDADVNEVTDRGNSSLIRETIRLDKWTFFSFLAPESNATKQRLGKTDSISLNDGH